MKTPSQLWFSLWLRWHRLDFKGEAVSSLGLDPARCHEHAMSGGPHLRRVLRSLDTPPGSRCIDYGSGKGVAALTLARHFAAVTGIELSPRLVDVARRNARRLRLCNAWFVAGDAADFVPRTYTHAYAFNPFPATVLAQVAANIARYAPRPFIFVYKNPCYPEALTAASFRRIWRFEFRHDHPCDVFVLDGGGA